MNSILTRESHAHLIDSVDAFPVCLISTKSAVSAPLVKSPKFVPFSKTNYEFEVPGNSYEASDVELAFVFCSQHARNGSWADSSDVGPGRQYTGISGSALSMPSTLTVSGTLHLVVVVSSKQPGVTRSLFSFGCACII